MLSRGVEVETISKPADHANRSLVAGERPTPAAAPPPARATRTRDPGEERRGPQREHHQAEHEQPEQRERRPPGVRLLHERVEHAPRRAGPRAAPGTAYGAGTRPTSACRARLSGAGEVVPLAGPGRSDAEQLELRAVVAGGAAERRHAEPRADRERRRVVRAHDGVHLVEAAVEAPRGRAAGRLGGVAVAPGVGVEVPADLELAVAVGQRDQDARCRRPGRPRGAGPPSGPPPRRPGCARPTG